MSEASGYQISTAAARAREQYAVRYFMEPWVPGLLAVAALCPGERVLDVACGSGVVARHAAPQVGPAGSVTGLDINAEMLDVARALPAPAGAPVTWVEASALTTGLPDACVDVVLCQQGLQFFPDKVAAFREMHRVLVTGGRVVLSVWKSAGPYNVAQTEAVERYVSAAAAERLRASRRVPSAEALQRMLAEAGFRDVQVRQSAMRMRLPPIGSFVLAHLSGLPVAEAVAAVSEDRRAALAADVAAALQPYADEAGASVPDEINIATGRK